MPGGGERQERVLLRGEGPPWAAGGNELLVSYCTNAWEFARLFRDEKVYRPSFVRVRLAPAK